MSRFWRGDALAAVFLAVLASAIYFPLTFQGRVLASFDSLVYFYPNALYLAERLRAGQIPLWDPYIFAGVPFLANSQVGALYPPNLLYLLGPVSRIYAILVVAHVWLLAFGVYLLGRYSLGLGRLAALFAAVAIAFGGFVGGMNGHLNQLEALAWAPLAILAVERGVARRSWRFATLAALPFALALLAGHSQELYMTGVVAGLAGLGRAVQGWVAGWPVSVRRVAADVGRIALGPFLAVLITGAQLLPTLELTRESIRSTGLDFDDATSFSLPPPDLLISLLPTIGQMPSSTEWLGYVGLAALIIGLIGLWRRPSLEAWWLAGLSLLGLLLALGEFTPLYRLAFDFVPGVRLFRVPARWLTLWTLGTGLLAGYGVDALLGGRPGWRTDGRTEARDQSPLPLGKGAGDISSHVWNLSASRIALVGALLVAVVLAAAAYHERRLIIWPTLDTFALWAATLVALRIIAVIARRWRTLAGGALLAVLIAELEIGSLNMPFQQAVLLSGVETSRLSVDFLVAQHSPDRVFALGDNSYDPGDLTELRQMLAGTLSKLATADYVTAVKHVEGLTPNLSLRFGLRTIDGYDGGILPLHRFGDLKKLFPVQGPTVSDGRIRLQLSSAPDPRLLGWLDVRYLLMNRLQDQWISGVYYDLAMTQDLQPSAPLALPVRTAFPTTALGVILRGKGGPPPDGTLTLRAGGETATVTIGPGKPTGQHLSTNQDPGGSWLWTVDLPRPVVVRSVTVSWQGTTPISLRSLSLIDRRTGLNESVVVSPAYRLVFLGDMKIYENQDVLPRAFLADGLDVVSGTNAVVTELSSPSWSAQASAVASAQEVSSKLAFRASGAPGQTRIVDDEPERVVVETSAPGRRVLVLTDSDYPGWNVTVDGVARPILPVNTLFRGVILGPGAHRVVFSYQPIEWRLGLAMSAVGIIGTAALLLFVKRD